MAKAELSRNVVDAPADELYPNSVLEYVDVSEATGLVDAAGVSDRIDEDAPNEAPATQPYGFWRRQFRPEVTRAQKRFDILSTLVLPALCFLFDPFVFRPTHIASEPFLSHYSPFAHVGSFGASMALLAWILWEPRLKGAVSVLGGVFGAASFASAIVGGFLLPISLIGMVFAVGFLGFSPLLYSFTMLRSTVRVLRSPGSQPIDAFTAAAAAVITLSVLYVLNTVASGG